MYLRWIVAILITSPCLPPVFGQLLSRPPVIQFEFVSRQNGFRRARIRIAENLFSEISAREIQRRLTVAPGHTETSRFALFPDVSLDVVWRGVTLARDGETWIWTGRVAGDPFGVAVVVVNHDRILGSLRSAANREYRFYSNYSGEYIAEEATQARPFLCGAKGRGDSFAAEGFAPNLADQSNRIEDDGTVIDVLIYYTDSAGKYFNALGVNADIKMSIALVAKQMNETLAAQSMGFEVNVVAIKQLDDFDENKYMKSDPLERMYGFLYEIARRLRDEPDSPLTRERDRLGADIVSVWLAPQPNESGGPTALGAGESPTADDLKKLTVSGDLAFGEYLAVNVVDVTSSTTLNTSEFESYGWAHEMGHNFGLQHDRTHLSPAAGPPVTDYAFGYLDCFHGIGDIMSYACGGDIDYQRLPFYSSPSTLIPIPDAQGVTRQYSLGDNQANARKTMMEMAKIVANYRHPRWAELRNYTPRKKLLDSRLKVEWDNGVKVSRYRLTAGSTDGESNYFSKEFEYDEDHSAVIDGLPADGKSAIYIYLESTLDGYGPKRVGPFQFTAADPPKLSITGNLQTFQAIARRGAGSQKLHITSTGSATRMRIFSTDESWLTVTPSSGVASVESPLEVTIAASAASLPAQNQPYQEKIRVELENTSGGNAEQLVQLSVSGESKPAVQVLEAFPTKQPLPKGCRPRPTPVSLFYLTDVRFEAYFEFRGYAQASRQAAQMIDPDGHSYPLNEIALPNLNGTEIICNQAGAVREGEIANVGMERIHIHSGAWKVHLLLNGLRVATVPLIIVN